MRSQSISVFLRMSGSEGGKTDTGGRERNRGELVGPWKSGDSLTGAQAPQVAGKALEISAEIDSAEGDGVILSQGGGAQGYAIYLKDGKLAFAVRENRALTTITSSTPLGSGHFVIKATVGNDGALALFVNQEQVANGKASGPIPQQPKAGLAVGTATRGAVGEYDPSNTFKGKITNVTINAIAGKKTPAE